MSELELNEMRRKVLTTIVNAIFAVHDNGRDIWRKTKKFSTKARKAADEKLYNQLSNPKNDQLLREIFPEYPNIVFTRGNYKYSLLSAISKEGLKKTQRYLLRHNHNIDLLLPGTEGDANPLQWSILRKYYLCTNNILESKAYASLPKDKKAEIFKHTAKEWNNWFNPMSKKNHYDEYIFRVTFKELRDLFSWKERERIYSFLDRDKSHLMHNLSECASADMIMSVLGSAQIALRKNFLQWLNQPNRFGYTPLDNAMMRKDQSAANIIKMYGGRTKKHDSDFSAEINTPMTTSLDIPGL